MILPARGRISQGFSGQHLAVDIAGGYRSPIFAPHAGQITATGQMGTGTNDAGLAIDIDAGRFKSRLAHNDEIITTPGQNVVQGQHIGYQGYTGFTIPSGIEGTHCHWVLWDNGVRVDGTKYINDTTEEKMTPAAINLGFMTAFNRAAYPQEIKAYTGADPEFFQQTLYNNNLMFRTKAANYDQTERALKVTYKQLDELRKKPQALDRAKVDLALKEAQEALDAVKKLKE